MSPITALLSGLMVLLGLAIVVRTIAAGGGALATGVVLGGSIVGRHAAELISVIALAVTANLRVSDIVESLLVHPALSEALAEAAE